MHDLLDNDENVHFNESKKREKEILAKDHSMECSRVNFNQTIGWISLNLDLVNLLEYQDKNILFFSIDFV